MPRVTREMMMMAKKSRKLGMDGLDSIPSSLKVDRKIGKPTTTHYLLDAGRCKNTAFIGWHHYHHKPSNACDGFIDDRQLANYPLYAR